MNYLPLAKLLQGHKSFKLLGRVWAFKTMGSFGPIYRASDKSEINFDLRPFPKANIRLVLYLMLHEGTMNGDDFIFDDENSFYAARRAAKFLIAGMAVKTIGEDPLSPN